VQAALGEIGQDASGQFASVERGGRAVVDAVGWAGVAVVQ
jgi:hypothetical protein